MMNICNETKITLTVGQLKRLVTEALVSEPNERTKPFPFDHAEVSPQTVERETTDYYGRKLVKRYDKVLVYDSPTTKPYYIWTKEGNGKALANRLNRQFKNKWITARIMFDRGTTYRISSVGIEVAAMPVTTPASVWPKTPSSRPSTPSKNVEPEQMELDLWGRNRR